MRHLVIVLMLIFIAANTTAQQQTLLKSDEARGGFGAAVIKVTSIKDQSTVMFGGRGGWVINHSLLVGGGLYSIVNKVDADKGVLPAEEASLNVDLSYFGLEAEYIVRPAEIWHYSGYLFIGAGSTRYVKDTGSAFKSSEQSGESDIVFVTEPSVNAELNVTAWFHLDAGLSYRLVTGVNRPGLENSDLSGFTGTLTFKFGKF